MQSKSRLFADAALATKPTVIVDIGYAQEPNPFLTEHGALVYGVDILEQPSPYTKTFKVDLNTGTLPFADNSVDVVTMGCTLAHLANPLRALADINRVLAPNGRLIMSSPNPVYYWEVVLNIFFRHFSKRVSPLKLEEHFYDFSRYNVRACALVTGFMVTREVGMSFHLIKTPIRFHPLHFPGLAYEIIYTLLKVGEPKGFGKARIGKEVQTFETNLF